MEEIKRLKLVEKSNQLIEAKYRLTIMEQKLIIMAISKIDPTKPDFENPYQMNIKEVAAAIGLDGASIYPRVAATVDKLMTRLVKLKEPDGHRVVHWVSEAKYYTGAGYFELWFHEKMREYLLNLNEYLKYEAPNVLQLQSNYSIRIYEILKKWHGASQIKQKDGYYLTKTIDELKDILGIRKTEYKLYSNFKLKVIKMSQRELKSQTDLCFDFIEVKQGRKVQAITFIIKDNVPSKEPKKKRGRPKKNKSDQEIHLETNPPIEDFLNNGYSENLTDTLHSKGIVHHDKYKNDGIREEHWNKAIEDVGEDANPGLVVSSAKKHRDLDQPKETKPDHSSKNKKYWEEHQLKYTGLSYSTAYLQDSEGNTLTWADENFLDKLEKYRKMDEKREVNLFVESMKVMNGGRKQSSIVNKINQEKDKGTYTNWATDDIRHKGTNPENIAGFLVGRAYKENLEVLQVIFNSVYGEGWEIEAKERLAKKGIQV